MARGMSKQYSKRLEWQPAVPGLISGAEFCPTAVDEYMEMFRLKKKAADTVLLNFRKHLLYLGWRIHFVLDKEATRLRYSSPDGDSFYSLPQVCVKLGHVRRGLGPDSSIPKMPKLSRKITVRYTHVRSSRSSERSVSSPIPGNSGVSGKLPELFASGGEVVIEPEYCPEAVLDYSLHGCDTDRRLRAMKAKKHLSAIGWSFYYTLKGGIKRELRYSSPKGKVFNSLLTACKWCVDARALTIKDDANVTDNFGTNLSLNESHSALLAVESPGNSPSVSKRQARVPLLEGDICKTSIEKKNKKNKKQRTNDQSHCIESLRFPKRGRKGKSHVNMVADDISTHVRGSSKRVRDVVLSSYHQTPRTVLSWLIDNDVVLPRARVEYRGRNGLAMAEGRIAREGIKCSCCGVIFTLTKFEAHAGSTNHRPSANIFLDDGRSLMECQSQLKQCKSNGCATSQSWRKTNDIKANNDICSICRYGGDIVLCDRCPSSFHTQCIGLKDVPDGDWFCPSCCCQICGMGGFDGKSGNDIDCSVLTCCQCEHQYHAECIRHKGITKCCPEGYWFCQETCKQIFFGLRTILGKPIPVGNDNLTWTLLKNIKSDSASDVDEGLLEVYGKLNVALGVMHECFEPVKERGTGRDLVEDVIFSKWSGPNRPNFRGFYTVVLEKNDELISAATVRIYGKRVAEVPLVATRFQYRRLGMCRILMNGLEKKLMELGVERLVLPAIPSVLDTWTTSFGFSVMNEIERLKFLDCTFLDFQGTVICEKVLTSNSSSVTSQSTGKEAESWDNVNENGDIELDGNSTASEVFQGEQQMEEVETEFIEQESTW
ncbi:hypothetical protein OROMI_008902 [Orobanche minor]